MNNTEREALRAEFEAWTRSDPSRHTWVERACDGDYEWPRARAMWEAWLAARAAQPAAVHTTPRDEWPDEAITAAAHLVGLAFGAAPADELGHCLSLINAALAAQPAAVPVEQERGRRFYELSCYAWGIAPDWAVLSQDERDRQRNAARKFATQPAAPAVPTPAADGLPELPEPVNVESDWRRERCMAYTADQMRAVQRQAFELGRQQAAPQGLSDEQRLHIDQAMRFLGAYAAENREGGTDSIADGCEATIHVLGQLPAAPQAPAAQPVAWRYVPSEVWRDHVLTSDPEQAELARRYYRTVEPLFLGPQAPADERRPQPFHPDASHIHRDYRDGWNAALAAVYGIKEQT